MDISAIAGAAVELLDDGGLRALTVRSVAAKIEVAPASLYSRVESADDLFDLALDEALGTDEALTAAIPADDITELMLAYFRHLSRHRWACQVIAMRAPRGPNYLRLSERMVVLLSQAGSPDPLGDAYTLANFVIGSATTSPMSDSENHAPVDPEQAPEYARLHSEFRLGPEALLLRGLGSLYPRPK